MIRYVGKNLDSHSFQLCITVPRVFGILLFDRIGELLSVSWPGGVGDFMTEVNPEMGSGNRGKNIRGGIHRRKHCHVRTNDPTGQRETPCLDQLSQQLGDDIRHHRYMSELRGCG